MSSKFIHKKKKIWKKPKLVVLVRGRAEETVLEHCKGRQLSGPDAQRCSNPGGGPPCLSSGST